MAKSKNPPYAKGRGQCIFCGSYTLTREHIWANWLKAYIPRELDYSETHISVAYKNHVEKTEKKQPGDPHSHRVKAVCKKCNNGWMGRAQEKTKPLIIPLITGKPTEINHDAQTTISMWAAMAIMVGESREKNHVAISADERKYLMVNQKAPPNWRIWIGNYKRDKWKSYWFHNTLTIHPKEHVPSVADRRLAPPNTQTTAFVVGQLYIYAMSSMVPDLADRFIFTGSGASKIRQIWPIIYNKIDWPFAPTITNGEAHSIAVAVYNWAAKKAGLQTI